MSDTPAVTALGKLLRCPHDGAALEVGSADFRCPVCARDFPANARVIDFVEQANDFYEGKYFNEIIYDPPPGWRELPLWAIRSGYIWAVRRHVARGSIVVEMGCAAGVRWFGHNYRMIGLDFSKAALEQATVDYELGLRADALRMPLADNSVDAFVSASFFEHFAPADKPVLIAEMLRVLRPGGKIIFEHDVETNNPMVAAFRARHPALYQRLFLDGDGHIGYEPHAVNDAYFTDGGFELLWSKPVERLPLQPPEIYEKMRAGGGTVARMASVGQWLSGGRRLKPWLALVRLADVTVGRLAPASWGRIAITIAQKPL